MRPASARGDCDDAVERFVRTMFLRTYVQCTYGSQKESSLVDDLVLGAVASEAPDAHPATTAGDDAVERFVRTMFLRTYVRRTYGSQKESSLVDDLVRGGIAVVHIRCAVVR